MNRSPRIATAVIAAIALAAGCSQSEPPVVPPPPTGPTIEDADRFVVDAESRLAELLNQASRLAWVQATHITDDTEMLAAGALEALTAAQVEIAGQAAGFTDVAGLSLETRRKLDMLRSAITMPAPADPVKNAEQAEIGARLSSMYGKGEFCARDGQCKDLEQLEAIIENSRDPTELLAAWSAWREVAKDMKPLYERQIELANEGASELGFGDLGAMWRSGYDMPPEDFPAELDRLWGQVRPLYEALHCHVRAKLGDQYGVEEVPQDGLIPAHLLGNMWAQTWDNVFELVAPPSTAADYDLTTLLRDREMSPVDLVRVGESFFSSLGFAPLPESFWSRSLFVQPQDRDVVCHPSAWNVDAKDDLRIKMCIEVQEGDFRVIHHELGHNYYQRAYNSESHLFRGSANDGFHEAVGDAVALSITPEYLAEIGLLDQGARCIGGPGALDAAGPGQDCLPAFWIAGGPMALEGVCR